MAQYFNDSPIERAEDDQYGITPFAKAIAASIKNMGSPVGTTIAIHGPWGSGKSSAVNLIRNELDAAKDGSLSIVDFRCWWYRGEEALTLAFLQELNSALRTGLGDKVKGLIPALGRHILQAGPVIGTAVSLATTGGWTALIPGSADFAKRFFPDQEPLEKKFRKLSKLLQEQAKRFLIIIDDIDRLNPEEALAVFRLVKSVGRLPNVMYLLVFDRQLAEAAVADRYPSEGPHFLEKIIQASFELPAPNATDLNGALLAAVERICGSPEERHIVRFMNLFYDVVAPYLVTPRHVTRLSNAMSVTWPAVANEISRTDYVALEALRLYEPILFSAIRDHREEATGGMGTPHRDQEAKFEPFLRNIPAERHERLKIVLQRLFPSLENTVYGEGFREHWEAERRVCIAKHFDTYFRLSLSDDALSSADLAAIIAAADDGMAVQARFREAARHVRKSGSTMVPVLLDELTMHASEMDKQNVQPFLSALFEIADEIALESDRERGFAFGNTRLRFHWLIRALTRDRFTLAERTNLYLAATEKAATGWLRDFVASAVDDYERDKPRAEGKCLVAESALPELKQRALQRLRTLAEQGRLLVGEDAASNLYCWKDFAGEGGAEVRSWLQMQFREDANLVLLAKAFTGESWSHSLDMDGLGDRVSKRSAHVSLSDDNGLVDTTFFRAELNRITAEGRLPTEDIDAVRTFLKAWDNRRGGGDDDD